jgi:enhancing lycopene biosynthesis protein 2
MKKFAVILSGCGVYDGSEIHEAVMALLAVDKSGNHADAFAPDINQHHVINHITGQEMKETRNVLIESARISRGKIKPLSDLNVSDYDALLLPGGFGAAKNLSDYAFAGEKMRVLPSLEKVLKEMHSLKRPIGAMCISPVILANIFGAVELTIGHDEKTAYNLSVMGAHHRPAGGSEVVVDHDHKIASTPCYMVNSGIAQVAAGAEALVAALLRMM